MPITTQTIKRLRTGIQESETKLKAFRRERADAISEYLGGHYGNNRQQNNVKAGPLNMLWSGISVYVPNLVSRNPRFRVRTKGLKALRSTGWQAEEDLNQTMQELDYAEELRKIVVDSLFGVGIRKMGLKSRGMAQVGNRTVSIPGIFYSRVSLDRYVIDPHANDRRQALWEGDEYQIPYAEARRRYPDAKLVPTESAPGEQREASEASDGGDGKGQARVYPMVTLYDIWMPRENKVITIATDGPKEVLRVVPWKGPERGPYEWLYYHEAPDNIMPAAPVGVWRDLHDLINRMARKLERQADREKQIGIYELGAGKDADRVKQAHDGEWVGVTNSDRFTTAELGGATEDTHAFTQFLIQMFSRQAGNVDMLGGLSSEAKTATEAAKLQANAKTRVVDMRYRVYAFARHDGRHVAFWRWNNPFAQRRVTRRFEKAGVEITGEFSDQRKQGRFSQFNHEIVPHSMSMKLPQQHAQKLMQWWNNVVLPTAHIAAQQGQKVDVPAFVTWMAREMGIGEVKQFYRPAVLEMAMRGGGGRGPERPGGGENNGGEQSTAERMAERRAEESRTSQPKPEGGTQMPGVSQVQQALQGAR